MTVRVPKQYKDLLRAEVAKIQAEQRETRLMPISFGEVVRIAVYEFLKSRGHDLK